MGRRPGGMGRIFDDLKEEDRGQTCPGGGRITGVFVVVDGKEGSVPARPGINAVVFSLRLLFPWMRRSVSPSPVLCRYSCSRYIR